MGKDIKTLLQEYQTGEYIPDETELVNPNISMAPASADEPEELVETDEPERQPRIGPGFSAFRLPKDGGTMRQESLGWEAAQAGFGQSRFDRGEFTPGEDIENKRAIEQSGFNKILSGLAKGGVTAATTAINTTLGTVWGIGSSMFELATDGKGEGTDIGKIVDAGVNNWVAEQMTKIQQKSEEWFPNNRTEEERSEQYQQEWMKHILTPNFIGDSLLKNFGFTVGAMAGGAVWTKGISALMRAGLANNLMKGVVVAAEGDAKANAALQEAVGAIKAGKATVADVELLTKNIQTAGRQINKMNGHLQLYGSLLGAMGEGTTEGITAKNEYLEGTTNELDSKYMQDYTNLEQALIEELKDTDNVRTSYSMNDLGQFVPSYELNDSGKKILEQRRQELANDYLEKRKFMEEQGEKLATTTYMLNLPVLTLSNVVQFGRLFSGGWKTAKKLKGLTGSLEVEPRIGRSGSYFAPKVTASYESTAKPALKSVLGSLKVAGSESFEEMAQGTISSGAKKVASNNLAKFNNDGYDEVETDKMREWFSGMYEGGKEYLGDWKNWQEGFLGAVTGLFGIPGRFWKGEWNGGLVGEIQSAKAEKRATDEAVQKLNEKVNSKEFQDRWHGYIRHMKYDSQMKDALDTDNSYAWHDANSKQLVNDIMMFANAGKLEDLRTLVDSYSNITTEQAEQLKPMLVTDGRIDADMSPSDIVSMVKKRADDMQSAIQQYKDTYDALSVIMPSDASPELKREAMFTTMELKNLEKRFLDVFNDTMEGIKPKLRMLEAYKNTEGTTEENQLAVLERLNNLYKDIFSEINPIKLDPALVAETNKAIDNLKSVVRGDKTLMTKVNDLEKLANDRRDFYEKYIFLQSPGAQAAFDNVAITSQKVAEAASRAADREETKGLDTMDAIKQRYVESPLKSDFIRALRGVSSDSAPAKDFVDMYDTYNNFRQHLSQKYPNILRSNGSFSYAAEMLLDDMFKEAKNEKDFVDKAAESVFSKPAFEAAVQERITRGELEEEYSNPLVLDKMFNDAVNAITNGSKEFRESWYNTAGRKNVAASNTDTQTTAKEVGGVDSPAAASSSAKPEAKDIKKKEKPNAEPQAEQTGVSEEELDADMPVFVPEGQKITDSLSTIKDNTPTEEESNITVPNGDAQLGYYQQSIPEIQLHGSNDRQESIFDRVRGWLNSLKYLGVGEEQRRKIATVKADIARNVEDFVVFDDKGNAVGGRDDFAPTYKWLKDNGAFEYISTKLNVDDELVFCYMDGCPEYNNLPQVVVGVVTNRNENGEVSEVQPLTTLLQPNATASETRQRYAYLDDLYDAIHKDYKAQEPEGGLYVFGGKKNPITSRVFDIRPGIIPFGGQSEDIRKKEGYLPDAPIVIIGQDEVPILLRGNEAVIPKLNIPTIDNFGEGETRSRYGRMYYMIKNGNSYVPIVIDRPSLTKEQIESAPEGSRIHKIKTITDKLDGMISRLTPDNIEAANKELPPILKDLNSLISLRNVFFDFQSVQLSDNTISTGLRITWGKNPDQRAFVEPNSTTKVLDVLSGLGKPLQISASPANIDDSKANLKDAIDNGFITSDVKMLREKGVNFLFDPYNPKSGKFQRLLGNEVEDSPKADGYVSTKPVLQDAESEVGNVYSRSLRKDDDIYVNEDEDRQSRGIGNNEELSTIKKSYSELDDESKSSLAARGISAKIWDSADIDTRETLLYCK